MNQVPVTSVNRPMRIAVEGCGHGTLDAIYEAVKNASSVKGWDSVDLLIICGDFQAVRDRRDLNVTAMTPKYRQMGDFHDYYWGRKTAPYLTLFIGGNHEASNHLFELYYGGWAAPNIYYLGAANVVQFGPLKIASLSGIWKGYDYRKPHHERLPYNQEDIHTIYHVRELDARKLLAFRSQVDIGLSHDWPKGIEWDGDHGQLFRFKPYLKADAVSRKLGNVAAQQVLDHLRPPHWFSAHLHTRYAAQRTHDDPNEQVNAEPEVAVAEQPPPPPPPPSSSPPAGDQQGASVSAWNAFADTVKAEEAAADQENRRIQQERRQASDASGNPSISVVNYQETYKKVKLQNGFTRSVVTVTDVENAGSPVQSSSLPQVDGCCGSMTSKRRRASNTPPLPRSPVKTTYGQNGTKSQDSHIVKTSSETLLNATANPDAIDIDLSEDSGEDDHESRLPAAVVAERSSRSPILDTDQPADGESAGVSDELRTRLAALSTKFADEPEITFALPHPEDITNKVTNFLALSKCEPGQRFLQLLEIGPLETTAGHEGPLRLSYNSEWLAILRTFASELDISASARNSKGPIHRGDTYYRARILNEEKWIKENILDKNLLVIPENFSTTIPYSDPNLVLEPEVLPEEVTNSQTSAFCALIGIDNPFADEAEREIRKTAGPAPSSFAPSSDHGHSRGGRGGHRGGRGRGRGRGGRGRGHSSW